MDDLIEKMARASCGCSAQCVVAECAADVRAALKAADEAGFSLVPKVPTDAMSESGDREMDNENLQGPEDVYRAMVAAGAVKP